jgi:hypothetical protein
VRVLELVKDVSHLRATNDQLVDATSKLNARIASLSSAGRIESYAVDSLGLRPVAADHIYTLIGRNEKPTPPDELATMFRAIGRVTNHMPGITESSAHAGERRLLKPTSLAPREDDK